MTDYPKIDGAPGLKWRSIKLGWQAIWRARGDLVAKGYPIKSYKIWQSSIEERTPSTDSVSHIQFTATALQDEMLLWGRSGFDGPAVYTGTWKSLIRCFQTDPDSPYAKNEYASRQHYNVLCRVIEREVGDEQINLTDARRVLQLYRGWIKPNEDDPDQKEKIAMGHAVMGMMRGLLTYGKTFQKCPMCKELRETLEDMKFTMAKARESFLTADQVIAIRKRAHEAEKPYRHSIALAQALQFDVASGIRQKDIIGEWVPLSEPGISDVVTGNRKWLKGIRGEEIDENFILRHVTSKRKKLLTADLKLSPMVMEEFRLMAGISPADALTRDMVPRVGPLIVNEQTGLPYDAQNFRTAWREIARAVGVPDETRNMDSRSGAITEALAAGAPMEAVRKGATHSTSAMTSRYSRGDQDATATVMQYRSAARKAKE